MSESYEKAVAAYNKAKGELEELEREYAERKKSIEAVMESNKKLIEAAENGLDESKLELARKIVRIRWARKPNHDPLTQHALTDYYPKTKEVGGAIREAIEDTRNGFPKMMTKYFGVKAYEGWNSQREDHEYGYGPRYGSTWFCIGLRPDYRRKVLESGGVVSGEERIAVVYVLKQLSEGTEVLDYLG